MNNRQIAEILTRDVRARRVFRGVYPRNRLPLLVDTRLPSAYIINTDVASGPGKHWVAVWFDGRGNAEYFDSFGLPPIHADIETFLSRHCHGRYRFSQRLIQDLTSSACGLYVIYFVMMKSRGESLGKLMSRFSPYTLRVNDRSVQRYVNRIKPVLIG